jgi:hypothetical protein
MDELVCVICGQVHSEDESIEITNDNGSVRVCVHCVRYIASVAPYIEEIGKMCCDEE